MNTVNSSNKIPDLKIFGADRFSDFRGSYTETFNEEFFQKNCDQNEHQFYLLESMTHLHKPIESIS